MDITKDQAAFLLEAIKVAPIKVTYGQLLDGVKPNEDMVKLIAQLEAIANPAVEVAPTAEAEPIVAEVVTENPQS